MRSSVAILVVTAVLALDSAAVSAAPVTYNFTGSVTTVTGEFTGLIGSPVLGSFTLDIDAIDPARRTGDPVTSLNWRAYGGAGLLSQTVTLNGVTYSSDFDGGVFAGALLEGSAHAGDFKASTNAEHPDGKTSFWGIWLTPVYPSDIAAYYSDLNLNPDAVTFIRGFYRYGYYDVPGGPFASFNFQVTSLTAQTSPLPGGVPVRTLYSLNGENPGPVPLPAAVWLMASGLGMLGTFRKRRWVVR